MCLQPSIRHVVVFSSFACVLLLVNVDGLVFDIPEYIVYVMMNPILSGVSWRLWGRLKAADAERVGRACQEQARRPAGG